MELEKEQLADAWKILDPSQKISSHNEDLNKAISILVESSDLKNMMKLMKNKCKESKTEMKMKTEPKRIIKQNPPRGLFNFQCKRPQVAFTLKEAPKKGQRTQKAIIEKTEKILRNVKAELVDRDEANVPIVVTCMMVSRDGIDITRDLKAAKVQGKLCLIGL